VTRRSAVRCLSGLAASALLPTVRAEDGPTVLQIGGATIEVTFRPDQFDLPRQAMLDWVTTGARAVSGYFGRFPVPRASLEILMAAGRRGGRINGVTYADGEARSRLTVAQHVTVQDLERDWVLTHEMVHYGFPSMDEDHHWIEEGSATYIEPIARAAVGNLAATQVWGDMVRDMPQGLPAAGDRGLDHTHTWAGPIGAGRYSACWRMWESARRAITRRGWWMRCGPSTVPAAILKAIGLWNAPSKSATSPPGAKCS
jgi:hypothetical protein